MASVWSSGSGNRITIDFQQDSGAPVLEKLTVGRSRRLVEASAVCRTYYFSQAPHTHCYFSLSRAGAMLVHHFLCQVGRGQAVCDELHLVCADHCPSPRPPVPSRLLDSHARLPL